MKSKLDQPDPIKNSQEPLWPMVINDISEHSFEYGVELASKLIEDAKERHEVGVKRYGTPLQAFNGRKPIVDAYQEALDLLVYTKQGLMEESDSYRREVLDHLYERTMDICADLRILIDETFGR